jgi:MATE family multidrug resistance protein
MAAAYIDWFAFFFDSSDYVSRVQAICGWSSQTNTLYFMANVVHVFFNYVLIYGVWIFPKLESWDRSRNGFVQNNDGGFII